MISELQFLNHLQGLKKFGTIPQLLKIRLWDAIRIEMHDIVPNYADLIQMTAERPAVQIQFKLFPAFLAF